MAILNVTPDSFYADSRCFTESEVAARVNRMISEGADFIDIGACSTRPGASAVSETEEIDRLGRAMEIVRRLAPEIPVSVDTFRAKVASVAVIEMGCDIINDVSGGNLDPDMFSTVARLQVPYILTHSRGDSGNMQALTHYGDVTADVVKDLGTKLRELHLAGVNDVVVDPGIGFAKTIAQNYELLRNLEAFSVLDCPVLVGVSRKSLLSRLLHTEADRTLEATVALGALCLDRGASILRVHDVAAARQCVSVYNALTGRIRCFES